MHLDKTRPLREYTAVHAVYHNKLDKVRKYIPLIWGEASIEDIDRVVELVNEIIHKHYSYIEKL